MKSGYAAYDKGDMAGAIPQFLEAHALSERHGNYDRLCLASYNLGTSYFQLRGYNEALDYYIEALELCEKHKLPTSRRDIRSLFRTREFQESSGPDQQNL